METYKGLINNLVFNGHSWREAECSSELMWGMYVLQSIYFTGMHIICEGDISTAKFLDIVLHGKGTF